MILFHACISKSNDKKIASVGDKHLFLSDLMLHIPKSIDDSLFFVEKFIDDWIKRELLILYAEMNINKGLNRFAK